MFRKGGSAGEGITSGLAPRQGYNTNKNNTVKQNDLSKVNLKDMNMQQIKDLADRMAFQAPPMAPDRSLDDFKIDFGLDLISRDRDWETNFKQQRYRLKNRFLILDQAEQPTTKA